MDPLAFALPLRDGQTEPCRIALASCWDGPRKEAYQDARRRAGIVREAVWIQRAPARDVAVVYLEADDLGAVRRVLGTSGDPFDRWFRDHVRRAHGLELAEGFPDLELVLDFDINNI